MKSTGKRVSKIHQDKNFYIISLLTLMAILGGTIYNPALPTIANFFNVSSDRVSLVSTLFQFPGTIVTPIFGVLADTFGRKQVLVPSLLVFALGGALSGFAPNFRSLVEWRILQGIGTASLESLQLTIISDLYTGKKLTSVMAFVASLNGISSAIFPLIGGLLASFSWRYPFLTSLFAIPVAVMVLTTMKLPKQEHSVQNFQLKPYLKNTWRSINNRQVFGLLFAIMSLFMLQVGACLTYIPIFAGTKLGASEPVIGIILTSLSLSLALVASQLGLLTRHFSQIQLIKISFILSGLGLLIVPTVNNVWLLLIPIFFLGAAQGIAFPSTQALLAMLSSQESRAGFMGINSTIQSWGQTLGPLLGSIVDAIWGTQAVFYASAVFSFASFFVLNAVLTNSVTQLK
jgi:MFS family permease